MFLTKMILDISHPGIRRALRDCNEMHRDLMSAFPQYDTTARKSENVLFRLIERSDGVSLMMTSDSLPDTDRLCRLGYQVLPGCVKDISALEGAFREGMLLRFELLASPCKKCGFGQKNSRRVFLRTEEERLQWLERQGEKYGFQICNLEEKAIQTALDGKKNSMYIHYDAVSMSGVLKITDTSAFWQAYRQGIGPGKAYGLGMLTVSRIG